MGNLLGESLQQYFCKPSIKVVFVGEEGAGRTTALYQLKLGKTVTTVPTIGNNIEIINFEGMKMELWDLGGLCNVKQFWHNYYEDADAVVFFADLSNNEASYLQKSRDLLSKIAANKKISQVPILILANKKDRAVMSLLDLNRQLNLESYCDRRIKVIQTCSLTGEGFSQGLSWISSQIS